MGDGAIREGQVTLSHVSRVSQAVLSDPEVKESYVYRYGGMLQLNMFQVK